MTNPSENCPKCGGIGKHEVMVDCECSEREGKKKCDLCAEEVIALNSEEWYEENGCFCSSECRYEWETGLRGEEY